MNIGEPKKIIEVIPIPQPVPEKFPAPPLPKAPIRVPEKAPA